MRRRLGFSAEELGVLAGSLTVVAAVALAAATAVGLAAGGFPPAMLAPAAGGSALMLGGGLLIGSRRLAGAGLVLGGLATAVGIALASPLAAVPTGAALLVASEATTEALLRRGRVRLERGLRTRLAGRTALVLGVSTTVATLLAVAGTPFDERSVPIETAAVALAVTVIGAAAVIAHRRLRPRARSAGVA